MYKIEKGIKIPPKGKSTGNKTGRNVKYPFDDMLPGDSFTIPIDKRGYQWRMCRLTGAACRRQKVKIVCRKIDDYIRVWKMSDNEEVNKQFYEKGEQK